MMTNKELDNTVRPTCAGLYGYLSVGIYITKVLPHWISRMTEIKLSLNVLTDKHVCF